MHNSMYMPIRVYMLCEPGPELFIADCLSCDNHEENKDRDTRCRHKCQHYQHNSGTASAYIDTRYTRSNNPRCDPARAQGIYHTWLAGQKRWCCMRHTEILAHQTWVSHDKWCGHKKQMNNNTFLIADADIESAAQQPHGNQEDEFACVQIHVLGKQECWYRKHNKALFNISRTPEYTATEKKTIFHEVPAKPWKMVHINVFTLACEGITYI